MNIAEIGNLLYEAAALTEVEQVCTNQTTWFALRTWARYLSEYDPPAGTWGAGVEGVHELLSSHIRNACSGSSKAVESVLYTHLCTVLSLMEGTTPTPLGNLYVLGNDGKIHRAVRSPDNPFVFVLGEGCDYSFYEDATFMAERPDSTDPHNIFAVAGVQFINCAFSLRETVFVNCAFKERTCMSGKGVNLDNCFVSWLADSAVTASKIRGCTVAEVTNLAAYATHIIESTFGQVDGVLLAESSLTRVRPYRPESEWKNVSFRLSTVENCILPRVATMSVYTSVFTNTKVYKIDGLITRNSTFIKSNIKAKKEKRTEYCKVCKRRYTTEDMRKHGFCKKCTAVGSYSTPNERRVGHRSNLPPFSIEFEVHHGNAGWDWDDEAPYTEISGEPDELLVYGFTAHQDSSVDVEYKSPIYLSMAPFDKALKVMDTCREWVDDLCGTHIHVEFIHKKRLMTHYVGVFTPMVKWMKEHREETREFWGRYFGEYCSLEDKHSRYHWLNMTDNGKPTLEFRLPRFRNSEQYRAVVVFCRELAAYLDKEVDHLRTPQEYDEIALEVFKMYQQALATRRESTHVSS